MKQNKTKQILKSITRFPRTSWNKWCIHKYSCKRICREERQWGNYVIIISKRKKRRMWDLFFTLFFKLVRAHSFIVKGTAAYPKNQVSSSAHALLQRTSSSPTGYPNAAETPAGLERTSAQSWSRGMFASSLTALNSLMISRSECS